MPRKFKNLGEGEVIPTVIGTSGAMPTTTIHALRKLNITTKQTLITLSLIALCNSINIYNTFMDYDAQQEWGEGGQELQSEP
jgi:hypothetical protein